MVLGCIYRSPSENDACDSVTRLLNEASKICDDIIITGDFNLKNIES